MTYAELYGPNASSINTPVLWINKYLEEKIPELSGLGNFPFFPSTPSTINDLTEYFNSSTIGAAATWDRLIKMRRSAFPHIKCEQVMYYFYAQGSNPIETMIHIQETVLRLLDRGDESAREINNWAMNRQIRIDNNTVFDNQFYFHDFKIYQLEETRDIIDFGTARTYGGNKIIIDYDYHQSKDLTNQDWQPEPKAATKLII
jgi:hypothetical protein